MMDILQPAGWPRPGGYANGVAAEGRLVFIAGQIGWDETGTLVSDGLVAQIEQVLRNILAVLAEAGGEAQHLTRLTWYLTDLDEYLGNQKAIGAVWRAAIGRHYPAMTVLAVAGLLEPRAKVEIEATAVIPA